VRLKKLHHLLIGIAIGIAVVVPIGVFAFVKSGIYDVGAAKRHTKFTQWLTHETMIHSVRRHAEGIEPPPRTAAVELVSGYCSYETHCVACHGAAAVARQQWVNGLEPQPPYLLDVTQTFTPGQLFWIVKQGIKMTGMPAWGQSMSDREIWSVVAWLEPSHRMPPQTYARWRSERRCRALSGPPSAALSPIRRPGPGLLTAATDESAPSSPAAARP
jgi:mono/diheme cytochrome c family protein